MINIPVYFSLGDISVFDFGCKGDKEQCALLSDTVDILIFFQSCHCYFFFF